MPEYVNNGEVQSPYAFPEGKRFGLPQQVKHLGSYTAYYRFESGDVPINIVASSIKEAAKLASMPGVMGNDAVEPIQLKFDGKTVGVAMPVSMISFDTEIYPEGAKLAGACATPEHYDVRNGENVIFQVHEPFGYEFKGWFKDNQLISDKKIAEIDVYDNYATRLLYQARFDPNPSLRSGRYLDLMRGNIITIALTDNELVGSYGKAVWDTGTVASYNAIIKNLVLPVKKDNDTWTPGSIVFNKDPVITQPGQMAISGSLSFSPIGINIVVNTATLDNPYGYVAGSIISLQYMNSI
jgi:hypothetical protein